MNRSFHAALCVLIGFTLSGCKDLHEAVHPTNDSAPRSASPAQAGISSSASVVKVRAADVSIPAGGNADATVTLSISPGYHVNANPATFSYLIATEVRRVPEPDGFCAVIGKVVYPGPITKKFVFAEKPLAVYEGDAVVKLPLRLPGPRESGCLAYAAKGARGSLPIEVRVQACDSEKCYAPDTLKTTLAVDVK
jgi:uncharacterized protein